MRLRGRDVPLDHGYYLLAGISRRLPELRERPEWSVLPIRGRARGDRLELDEDSRLALRVPVDDVATILAITSQTLRIGPCEVEVGVAEVMPLRPASALRSRLVTIKGHHADPATMEREIRRRIGVLAGDRTVGERVEVTMGKRRVMRAATHRIVGFAVELAELPDAASLAIQASGIGGRRHMGAGVFIAPGRQS